MDAGLTVTAVFDPTAMLTLRVPKTSSILVTGILIIEARGSLPTGILQLNRGGALHRALRDDEVCCFDWRTSA